MLLNIKQKDIDRFWSKVEKTKGCWNWTGSKDTYGYGSIRIRVRGKIITPIASRISFLLENKEIPRGMCVCHKCDNPKCVRPSHLFLASHKENMRDMLKKGRRASTVGLKNPKCKLTEKDVLEIRKLYKKGNITHVELAKKFGVGYGHISYIIRRLSWTNI